MSSSIPLVPLPGSLATHGDLIGTHIMSAILGGGLCALVGVLILIIGVLAVHERPKKARDAIKEGYLLLGLAILFLIFGLYIMAVLAVGWVGLMLYAMVKGIFILGQKEPQNGKLVH